MNPAAGVLMWGSKANDKDEGGRGFKDGGAGARGKGGRKRKTGVPEAIRGAGEVEPD
jgi:hypothetical protein